MTEYLDDFGLADRFLREQEDNEQEHAKSQKETIDRIRNRIRNHHSSPHDSDRFWDIIESIGESVESVREQNRLVQELRSRKNGTT